MSLALSGSAATRRAPVSVTAAEGSSFKAQPRDARIFIGGVIAIGMGALFLQPPVERFGTVDLGAMEEIVRLGLEHARTRLAGFSAPALGEGGP